MKKKYYFFYEGDDDLRYIERIIYPLIAKKGFEPESINQYGRRRIIIAKYIKSLNSEEYLYLKDLDWYPCITKRKESVENDLSKLVDLNKIIIVIKEIESWYLAGVDEKTLRNLGVKPSNIKKIVKCTDTIDCHQFNEFFPSRTPRVVIMDSILDNYNLDIAKKRNKSLNYLLQNYIYG